MITCLIDLPALALINWHCELILVYVTTTYRWPGSVAKLLFYEFVAKDYGVVSTDTRAPFPWQSEV